MAFGKGNLTSPVFIQTGSALINQQVQPQKGYTDIGTNVVFPVPFSAKPVVTISRDHKNNTIDTYPNAIVLGIQDLTPSGFTITTWNSNPTFTIMENTYGYSYIAIGAY